MTSRKITGVFGVLAAALFVCTGCLRTTTHDDYKRNDVFWASLYLAHEGKEMDETFDRRYQKLLTSTEKRDALNSRIETEKLIDAVREDLKVRRGIELTKAQEQFDEIEKYAKRFEDEVGRLKANAEAFKIERSDPKNGVLFERLDKLEQDVLPKLRKRFASAKEAWTLYQQGTPLPKKI